MCAYSIGMYPDANVSPLLAADALMLNRPAGGVPRTRKVSVADPNGASAARRTALSARRPAGSVNVTVTPRAADVADLRCTAYTRSNGTPARAYSTSSSNSTLIAGTAATG